MTRRSASLSFPWRIAIAVVGVLSMAPTAGDVGGCGTEAKPLDPDAFAAARKEMDCERCQECGIGGTRCSRACDPAIPSETVLPKTCLPLYHDGEVCIRALNAASCDAYKSYVSDVAPSLPSECEFCQIRPALPTPPLVQPDAGGGAP